MRPSRLIAACGVALSLCFSPALMAQAVFGSIYGTVTDATGAVVPNAKITITDVGKGTSITVTSNESGSYVAQHLIPDVYNVKVEASGFQTFEADGIQVAADTSPRIDAQLKAGSTTQTVTVSASTIPELKTDRADVATEFNSSDMQTLPLPDRNFTNIQLLLPGAQQLNWAHAADEDPQGSKQIQVDGQAFGGVAYMLDGTDNQDPILGIIVINPALDAISNAKIILQNYDAEFGKAVSSFISVQTKSGSNQIHGSAFDYRESNANLATDPYSQFRGSGAFPPGVRNQFGGSIGGPVIKDRTFYFGDYQGWRQKVGIANTQTVPSSYLVSTCLGQTMPTSGIPGCDFSQYVANVPNTQIIDNIPGDPNNGKPFPGNVIPAADLSPQALGLLKLLQPYAPNTTGQYNGLKNNFAKSGTGGFNSDQWDVRIDDQVISDKAHAFARFSRFTDTMTGTTMFGPAGGAGFGPNGYGGNSKGANDSLASGMDFALSPKWLMDFRLGYFRYNIIDAKFDQGIPFAANLGIPGMNTGNYFTDGAPYFQVAEVDVKGSSGASNPTDGGPSYGSGLNLNRCNCPLTEREDEFQVVNNWTRIVGNHSIKFGADLRYGRNLRVPSDVDRAGIINFNPGPTSNSSTYGLGFATLMLGQVSTYNRFVSVSTNAKEFQKRLFFYAQDTWHMTPNLSVNYGMRYEYYSPEVVNAPGNGALMKLTDGYLHVAGVGGIGTNMGWSPSEFPLAPRVGVAYSVNPTTVIRAGYGRSFDIGVFGSIFGHVVTQNLPVLAQQSINNPTTTAYAFCLGPNTPGCTQPASQPAGGGPAPYVFPLVPSTGLLPNPGYGVSSKVRPDPLRLPTLDAWNLSMQHALTPTLSATLAYVGNKGTHTLSAGDGNTTNPNETAIFLPSNYSITGAPLHYDPSVPSSVVVNGGPPGIAANGGTAVTNYLQRYYGGTLPACQSAAYEAQIGKLGEPGVTPGMCGWIPGVNYYGDNQDSHYNALDATLAKQFSHGLSFSAQYSWQRAYAWNSSFSTWNRHAVKERDPNVREQQFVLYGTWNLPFGRNQMVGANVPRAVDEIIGGWIFSPVLNWSSGLPYTLAFAECSAFIPGDAPCSVNGVPKNLPHGLTKYDPITHSRRFFTGTSTPLYNTSTGVYTSYLGFSATGLDQLGSSGLNNMYGPGFFNGDLSLMKNFPVHESIVAQFRLDAYNGFNYMAQGNPGNTNLDGGSSAGVISACAGINNSCNPRQLQFSLRVDF